MKNIKDTVIKTTVTGVIGVCLAIYFGFLLNVFLTFAGF